MKALFDKYGWKLVVGIFAAAVVLGLMINFGV